jgi:hypothetical protein
MLLDTGCGCTQHKGLTCDDARTARRDPSGTLDLRRRFVRSLETRWRKLNRLVTEALVKQDWFSLQSPVVQSLSAIGMQGGRVPAFQTWFDTALAAVLIGPDREEWIGQYVKEAYGRGFARAAVQVERLDLHVLADRADLITKLTITELQGIVEVVSQQVMRAFGDGLLAHDKPKDIARLIRARVDSIGVVRSRAMAEYMVVRAVAEATLDVMVLAGRTHVGVVPETLPSPGRFQPVRDAKRKRKTKRKRKVRRRVRLERVEVLTAGDDDVCPVCVAIADESPYTIDEARGLIPAHPRCRCAFVPADDERFSHEELA